MSEELQKTKEQLESERKAAEFYHVCKRLNSDKEFMGIFWETVVGDRLEAADSALKDESVTGENLAVTRKIWKIMQELLTLPEDTVLSYERIQRELQTEREAAAQLQSPPPPEVITPAKKGRKRKSPSAE